MAEHENLKIETLPPKHLYIGETSGPGRARAKEHVENAESFKTDSFILRH